MERRGAMKWSGLTMMVAVMVNLHFGFTWNHLGDTLSGCVCENEEGKTNPKCGWHNPTDWDFRLNEEQKEEKASRAAAFTRLPAEGRLVLPPACSPHFPAMVNRLPQTVSPNKFFFLQAAFFRCFADTVVREINDLQFAVSCLDEKNDR